MINVRTLKEGDKIRRVAPSIFPFAFTKGAEYEVFADSAGLFIREENGGKYDFASLRANAERWELVEDKKRVGMVSIGRVETTQSFGSVEVEVTVRTDDKGFASLQELETKSKKEVGLRALDSRIAEAEEKLARLKRERESIK